MQVFFENNVKIAALSRNKEKLERIYKEYIKAGRVKIIAQDASKPINDDIGCIDYIFHAASPISGAVIKESPVDVIEPNVLGTKYLLDFLKNQAQKTGKKARHQPFFMTDKRKKRELMCYVT